MKLKAIPFLLTTSILTACQPSNDQPTAPKIKEIDAAVSVNGKYISKAALEILKKDIAERSRGQQQNIPQEKLIDELIKRELLIQDAKKKKLDKSAEVAAQLVEMKKALLTQVAVQDYMKSHPVSDADLKVEYDKQIGNKGGGTEFKARHILLKTEDEAKAVIAELDKGGDFSELAKTKSTGPSKSQGGDLGWFAAKQMVAPFSEAVAALDNGTYTKTAVKTQFGWHVIIREDSRQQTPPPFEAVKTQLEPIVKRQKLTTYLDGLRQQADVKILITEEVPADAKKVIPVTTPVQ